MTILAEFMIVAGAENRPPMLDKAMYNSWESRMLLYIKGKKNGKIMLESIKNGPLVYPTVEEDGFPHDVYALVNHYQSVKDIWERVKLLMKELAVPVFLLGDDPIACLNKALAFMSTVVASHFSSTNNQLRTSSNTRNQATIQDGRVKMLLSQAQEFGQVLDEEQLAFLADHGITDYCDDISSAIAVLMANLSSYDSEFLSEITRDSNIQDTNSSAQQDSILISMFKQMCALKQEIDSLKQTLSKQVKEKGSLLQTLTVLKKESKEQENKYMDKEIDLEKKIKELDNSVYKVGQSAQILRMLTKPQVFYDDIHKQALGYQNLFYLKKAQRIRPTLYDGIVISKKHDVLTVVDEEETLILEEEIRSKMLAKQNDPIMKKQKINTSPIDYNKLNKLADDLGKCFVPQMQLAAEQAFWLLLSNPKSEQLDIIQTPVDIEVPKELPKISLVKISFQKLKNHLASFDKVVKVRTTLDAITEGSWDVMNTIMHADSVLANVSPADNKYIVHMCVNSLASRNDCHEMQQRYIDKYNENLMLKAELAKKGQMVEKIIFDEVFKGKNVIGNDVRLNNPNVIAPRMLKLDLAPLAPKLLNNRDAHIDYIKHSREHADILREIVKHTRALRPLDIDLDSACKIVQRIQEVLVYVRNTCPSLTKSSEKSVVTPLNRNKKVRFSELATSSSNIQRQVDSHKTQDSNKPVLPSTGMNSSTEASESKLRSNTKKDRIPQTPSSTKKKIK
ncbi:hypothetical protein Tco_0716467 [Tanacetum coccineum]